ncbi:MAG: hypothetical protein IPG24_19185 [Leptospiraceae bacterium]|nr:hypothetical protein [Leptospiraceae bacterium]
MKFFLTILLTLFSYCSSVQVVDKTADTVPGFTPIKDNELANRYAPLLAIGSEHGDPFAIYYRASKDLEGNTHITYHYFWEKEENTHSGTGPFFNRNIYTGGIKLQKSMFGKGDIEMVSFMIDLWENQASRI